MLPGTNTQPRQEPRSRRRKTRTHIHGERIRLYYLDQGSPAVPQIWPEYYFYLILLSAHLYICISYYLTKRLDQIGSIILRDPVGNIG